MTNADDFKKQASNWIVKVVPSKLAGRQRAITFFALKGLVFKTPVDEGPARGNWQVGNNNVPQDVLTVGVKDVAAVLAREKPTIDGIQAFSRTSIANNSPYIEVLDKGGFVPKDPPTDEESLARRASSRDQRQRSRALAEVGHEGGTFVKGGFSLQAPRGMLAVTFQETVHFAQRASVLDERSASGGA